MMNNSDLLNSFKGYADRTYKIRSLSSPIIDSDDTPDNYSRRLQENFRQIGKFAAINRKMLDDELYPLLRSEDRLDDTVAEELNQLADMLLNVAGENDDFENLDLPITSMITGRLLSEAEHEDDIVKRIKRMDSEFMTCYSMMNMTSRISSNPGISKYYIDKGLALGEEFIHMLDKDFFLTIEDEKIRELVLTNARFTACFFDCIYGSEEKNSYNLEILDKMLAIAKDSFYRDAVPGFDWKYFTFRAYEYYVQNTQYGNVRKYSPDHLKKIEKRSLEFEKLLDSDPEYYSTIPGSAQCPLYIARCRYYAGGISVEEYKSILTEAYNARNEEDFGYEGCNLCILVPLELICLIDPSNMTAEEVITLRQLYKGLVSHLLRAPNTGSLSFMLEYYSMIIDRFIEVPSGVRFEDFVLQCIAAIHPPTYIHSHECAQISECLCYHLLSTEPERFIGFPGCNTVEEVIERKDEILEYTFHASLCHDFGKINIIDTVFVYGRKLLDFEFNIIKNHPVMGAQLLAKHGSTRKYVDVALGHHKWYDNKGGYPEEFDTSKSPYKTIIDIVLCADCMDAATDSVGRSYNQGKTLHDYLSEIKKDAGTRYAPWLSTLLERKEVFHDIEYLLTHARELNYRDTYKLLRSATIL